MWKPRIARKDPPRNSRLFQGGVGWKPRRLESAHRMAVEAEQLGVLISLQVEAEQLEVSIPLQVEAARLGVVIFLLAEAVQLPVLRLLQLGQRYTHPGRRQPGYGIQLEVRFQILAVEEKKTLVPRRAPKTVGVMKAWSAQAPTEEADQYPAG